VRRLCRPGVAQRRRRCRTRCGPPSVDSCRPQAPAVLLDSFLRLCLCLRCAGSGLHCPHLQRINTMNRSLSLGLLLGTVLATAACARAAEESSAHRSPAKPRRHRSRPARGRSIRHCPSPSCTRPPAAAAAASGSTTEGRSFQVDVRDTDDMNPIKVRLGVPVGRLLPHRRDRRLRGRGPHPAEDIKRLLAERPAARGLVLPGMPAGARHGNARWLRAAVHR
jgi:hypothetical protein